MNTTINAQLEQLQQKMQLLLKHYAQLQRENVQLKKDVAKKQQQLTLNQQVIQQQEQQIDALRLSKDGFSVEEKKELERRIDVYIREIDRCMSLLNT